MKLSAMQATAVAGLVSTGVLQGQAAERTVAEPARPTARWTLATADTRLVIGIGPDSRPYIYELSSLAGWNWTANPSSLPLLGRVDVGGIQKTPDWTFRKAVVDKSDGIKLTLAFVSSDPPLELTSIWHAHKGPGPVHQSLFIKNDAAQTVTIYNQESLGIRVVGPDSGASVCYINDDGSFPDRIGVYHEKLSDGYQKILPISEDQDFIPFTLVDANGEQGVYIGWEWSVGRIVIAADGKPGGASLKAGNGDTFKTDLDAGETFEVPPGFIGAYKGDLDDAGNSLRKYLFNHSMPAILKTDSGYPKVEWNAFAATGKGQGSWKSTETKYYPLIDEIAPMGFEDVVLDIGWWEGDTTHRPHPIVSDPVNWPSGMLAARDYAHDRGMRFGLYWNCNPSMTSPAGMEHRIEDATYLYDKFHIDFYRSDSTDGNVLQTGGHGPGMRAHYAEDEGYWQTKGYYEVLDSLQATIPNFSYENCSSGGHIKDYGILKRCIKIQNQDRYYPLDARQSFYDSTFALHPMQLAALCGSWADWQATGSVYEFRSSSMGAAYWHPDAPNGGNGGPVWTASQKALIQEAVHTYKTRLRPLIRNGNLYHIFPRPDDKVWDGIEYYDPASKRGAVYIFRPNSPVETQAVVFKGLNAKANYWLWCEDGSIPPTRRSGADLMQAGMDLTLAQPYTSEILFFQNASLGKPVESPLPSPESLGEGRGREKGQS